MKKSDLRQLIREEISKVVTKEGIVNENKQEAIDELQDIMDQLYELSDSAKMIFRKNFPSEYNRLKAYGALDFGTSSNRYDVTFEGTLENLGMEDDDEDMMQEDLDPDLKTSDEIRAQIKKYKMALASMSGKQQKAYYDAYIKPLQQKLDDME